MNSVAAPTALAVPAFVTITECIHRLVYSLGYTKIKKIHNHVTKSAIYVFGTPTEALQLPCYLSALGGLGLSMNGSNF